MPLYLTDDQAMLRDTARSFMAGEGAISKQLRHWRDKGCGDGFGKAGGGCAIRERGRRDHEEGRQIEARCLQPGQSGGLAPGVGGKAGIGGVQDQ